MDLRNSTQRIVLTSAHRSQRRSTKRRRCNCCDWHAGTARAVLQESGEADSSCRRAGEDSRGRRTDADGDWLQFGRPPGHLQRRGGQPQLPHTQPSQPVVVGEHDRLSTDGCLLRHPRKPVDLCRVHRMHRMVDHQEPEGARRQGPQRNRASASAFTSPWLITLSADPSAPSSLTSNPCDAAWTSRPAGLLPVQSHIAFLAQHRPDARGLPREPLVVGSHQCRPSVILRGPDRRVPLASRLRSLVALAHDEEDLGAGGEGRDHTLDLRIVVAAQTK
jgi:hypothetical protein